MYINKLNPGDRRRILTAGRPGSTMSGKIFEKLIEPMMGSEGANAMKDTTIGVIVGRFQTPLFTKGHRFIINAARR